MAASTLGKVLESFVNPRFAQVAASQGDPGLLAVANYFPTRGWDDPQMAKVAADMLEEHGSPYANVWRDLAKWDKRPDPYWLDQATETLTDLDRHSTFGMQFGMPDEADLLGDIRQFKLSQIPEMYAPERGASFAAGEFPALGGPNEVGFFPWTAGGGERFGDEVSGMINNFVPESFEEYWRRRFPEAPATGRLADSQRRGHAQMVANPVVRVPMAIEDWILR